MSLRSFKILAAPMSIRHDLGVGATGFCQPKLGALTTPMAKKYSENLDRRKGSEVSSQASATTRKSHDAAVGALVHMLRTAPPLRQDSSCYTSHSIKTELEGERSTASGFFISRKASDALEELKTYKELKDLLLSKSTTRSVSDGI